MNHRYERKEPFKYHSVLRNQVKKDEMRLKLLEKLANFPKHVLFFRSLKIKKN